MHSNLHILLVNANRGWINATRHAAAESGGGAIEIVDSSREAVARLLTSVEPYSHVLVQPDGLDDLVGELHGLTNGEPGSDTRLLLLGAGSPPRPGIAVVQTATAAGVSDALTAADHAVAPEPPKLAARDLRDSLAEQMFEVRYQPLVRMRDAACVGVEALARLNHPQHGTLSPVRFVAEVEQAGLSRQFTEQVSRHAMEELASPELRALGLTVALNFPLNVVLAPGMVDCLDAHCAEAGVSAGQITIELVETQPVEDLAALRRVVEKLRARGYGIAIDDLSPALPSRAALLEVPFTMAKLDRAVIRRIDETDSRAFLTRAVSVAHANHLTVTAEGVEDYATWQRLGDLDVDYVQGFLVSRPLPGKTLPVWLHAWRRRRTHASHLLRGEPDQTSS